MKKIISCFLLLFTFPLWADTHCFIAQENDKVLLSEGECKERHSPCSTFKLPLSVMGYNEGILIDETQPTWPYDEKYEARFANWRQAQTPSSWIKNSCIWYSQVLTQKLGIEKFKQYVKDFDYGNQDLSGNKGKNDGLTQSWLSSSLAISPQEQIIFIKKLLAHQLPVSEKAYTFIPHLFWVEDLPNGWKLYGKTGSGFLQKGFFHRTYQIGWFVGWLQKGDRTIPFASYIEDQEEGAAGARAKDAAKKKLLTLLSSL